MVKKKAKKVVVRKRPAREWLCVNCGEEPVKEEGEFCNFCSAQEEPDDAEYDEESLQALDDDTDF